MTTIFNAEPLGYSPEARKVLTALGDLMERQVNRAELLAILPAVEVLIVRMAHEIDRDALSAATRLRVIATATTGLDHIDVGTAAERGIAILSLAGETAFLGTIPATAEYTWALLLALQRRVPAAAARVHAGVWSREGLLGSDLRGRRLGIVGVGRIGQKVARMAGAFDMIVSGFDPYLDQWPNGIDRAPDLESLLRNSDIVTLHVPLNAETKGIMGSRQLECLPPGAVLINTSRGDLIDESALVDALATGAMSGAALDVLRHERQHADLARSPLLAYARSHNNLLITPHVGGYSRESLARAELFVATKLAAFLNRNPTAPAPGPGTRYS